MKYMKYVITMLLTIALIMGNICTAFASEGDSSKEEVIYVTMDTDGEINGINAVNIFGEGDVCDYGNYSEVKLLNSSADITMDGDKVTFTTSGNRVYYQGTMESDTPIPWNISLRYVIDGEEISPDQLAGQDGDLKIYFTITPNSSCQGEFYDNYALQATFSLDTNLCSDITAADATIADSGENKQLTYTILPGKGIDTVISATVHDFEMPSVTINGVALNLNIEIDDEELLDAVDELMSAVNELDSGSATLYDGTSKLKSGSATLSTGSSNLYSGVSSLDQGIDDLQTGINTLQDGLTELNENSSELTNGSAEVLSALTQIQTGLSGISGNTDSITQLKSASGKIGEAISNLNEGAQTLYQAVGYSQYKEVMLENGLDIDQLIEGNTTAAAGLDSAASQLAEINDPSFSVDLSNTMALLTQLAQDPTYSESAMAAIRELNTLNEQVSEVTAQLSGLEQLSGNAALLSQAASLLRANNGAISGTDSYLSGISANLETLSAGLEDLNENYAEFDSAINTLSQNLETMTSNLLVLKTGINTLVDEYGTLDSGIQSYTSGVASLVAGYQKLVSGTSELASGSQELLDGAGTLKSGTAEFYTSVSKLCDGASDLTEGMSQLNEETSGMDTTVQEKIDAILASVGGSEFVPVSFTSDKNTNVSSVQFVMKTAPIEITETQATDTDESEQTGFWKKLLKLFGI